MYTERQTVLYIMTSFSVITSYYRERERERETERQTDRQTDRQREVQRDRDRESHQSPGVPVHINRLVHRDMTCSLSTTPNLACTPTMTPPFQATHTPSVCDGDPVRQSHRHAVEVCGCGCPVVYHFQQHSFSLKSTPEGTSA